ncbi:MAG: hypothetical protein F2873_07970 [Actinobacteria bacterium]|uniref:Unannotated protein n=1 Tax=freshwater metagenome TaxID=449393 RepID=A0A6J7NZG7_9ZZZZ|nr:hypothetical protein [Actinomycetota bacterium]MSX79748.1 hypothetical protein [Actinomycetota bacterium]
MPANKSSAADQSRAKEAANQFAAAASQAWLGASGLATEIEALRWTTDSIPIPAPGLEQALEEARGAAMDSTSAADRIFTLLEQPLDTGTVAAVRRALSECEQRCADTQLWTRRLAQLCLGVTTFLAGNDAIALTERAAVIVLVAPFGERRTLPTDGLHTTASNYETLNIELAGILCRLIIEHDWIIELSVTSAAASDTATKVTLAFSHSGILELHSNNPTVPSQAWHDPVVVAEPVAHLIELFRRLTIDANEPFEQFAIRLTEPTLHPPR